jgi:MFS family permease
VQRTEKLPAAAVWLIGGATAHSLAETFYDLAMPLLILQITGSAFMMAMMFAVGYGAEFLVAIVGGTIVDRLSRRYLLTMIIVFECAILAGAAALAQARLIDGWGVVAVAALFDFAVQLYLVADVAALPTVVSRSALPKANGFLQMSKSTAQTAGPLLAGIAIFLGNISVTLALTALFLVPLVPLLRRVTWPADAERNELPGTIVSQMREGLTFTFGNPLYRALILWRGLFDFAFGASYLMAIFYMRVTLHFASWQIGAATAIMASGGVAGGYCFAAVQKRIPSNVVITIATATVAVSFLLLSVSRQWWLVGLDLSLLIICMSIMNRLTGMLFQATVPAEYLGRVLSSSDLLSTFLGPISIIGAAWLSGNASTRFVFLGSAIVVLALAGVSRVGVMGRSDWGIRPELAAASAGPELDLMEEPQVERT